MQTIKSCSALILILGLTLLSAPARSETLELVVVAKVEKEDVVKKEKKIESWADGLRRKLAKSSGS